MKADEFLETAIFLKDSGDCEGDFRSSVSRSYYATFLEARELVSKMAVNVLKATPQALERKSTHKDIQDAWKSNSSIQSKEIGKELKKFHRRRKDADYNRTTPKPFDIDDADFWITKAETILALIDDCHKDPLYSRIQPSMESWVRVNIVEAT